MLAITEVAYLLARDIGNDAAADLVSSFADTESILDPPLAEDYLIRPDTVTALSSCHETGIISPG